MEVFDFLKTINSHNRLVFQDNQSTVDDVLSDYDKTVNDDAIDYDLITHIIKYIHNSQHPGSILVFLPGYDDIMYCQDHIVNAAGMSVDQFAIFTLHGSMQISSQRGIFNIIPGKRKIILATNIAETSITIDDVVFVIDTGKAKEKTYDAVRRFLCFILLVYAIFVYLITMRGLYQQNVLLKSLVLDTESENIGNIYRV